MIYYTMLAAVSLNGVMGNKGTLPWYLPGDLQHFKKLTLGHTLIMGRKTMESLPGPLPKRQNLVLSKSMYIPGDIKKDGFKFFKTVEAIEEWCQSQHIKQVMVIGGAEIYQLYLPLAKEIILTKVQAEINGDTYFPKLVESIWKKDEFYLSPKFDAELNVKDQYPWMVERWYR